MCTVAKAQGFSRRPRAGEIRSDLSTGGAHRTKKPKAAPDTNQIVRRTIEHLQRRVRVRLAVLFGSHVRGEADAWSDVDLAVISPDFARMSHRKVMDLLVETVLETDSTVEIRPYTPRNLKEARPTNFLGHILAVGKVVYKDGEFLL